MKHKYKVLIVDQEETPSGPLKALLEQEDYGVETTGSAMDALEKIKGEKYHIVLIDVGKDEMNGIELLKEIKSYDALTQVIMMAKESTMEKILTSLEYGANDYILKPFESVTPILEVIDLSVQKLERWREAIIHVVQ